MSENSSRRFIDNGDGTITDTQTNLLWQKQDDGHKRTFEEAKAYCNDLALGGHNDWRLPTIEELMALSSYWTQIFSDTKNDEPYWSSTVHINPYSKATESQKYAAKVIFSSGEVNQFFLIYHYYVRAVCDLSRIEKKKDKTSIPEELTGKPDSLGKITLGRIYYSAVMKAYNNGEDPLPINEWGEKFGPKIGVNFIPPAFITNKTTYKRYAKEININDEEMRNLLKAFKIEDIDDLSIIMEETYAHTLGLKEEKKGCFVATVVFEDNNALEVSKLRTWRDSVLSKSVSGRMSIIIYNIVGPIAARFVNIFPQLKVLLRRLFILFLSKI